MAMKMYTYFLCDDILMTLIEYGMAQAYYSRPAGEFIYFTDKRHWPRILREWSCESGLYTRRVEIIVSSLLLYAEK